MTDDSQCEFLSDLLVSGLMEKISEARRYAILHHGDQKYGDAPYVVHLDAVANVMSEFDFSDSFGLTCAYLHDIVEDTNVTAEDLRRDFSAGIALVVDACSKPKGMKRRESTTRYYPKLKAVPFAVVVKLADRIANVRNCIQSESGLLSMYKKEYPEFRAALFPGDSQTEEMWTELDKLMEWSSQ